MSPEEYDDLNPPLTSAEQASIRGLSVEDIASIDRALLSCLVLNWRKLALVVAVAMDITKEEFPEIPDTFYAQRVMALAKSGLVESQGNLRRMRYSEVRLSATQRSPSRAD